jgi:hypothetical protein
VQILQSALKSIEPTGQLRMFGNLPRKLQQDSAEMIGKSGENFRFQRSQRGLSAREIGPISIGEAREGARIRRRSGRTGSEIDASRGKNRDSSRQCRRGVEKRSAAATSPTIMTDNIAVKTVAAKTAVFALRTPRMTMFMSNLSPPKIAWGIRDVLLKGTGRRIIRYHAPPAAGADDQSPNKHQPNTALT